MGHLVLLTGNRRHPVDMLQARFHRTLGDSLLKRIRFFSSMHVQQYYRLMSLATMILDSSVYAGGMTSFDAFAYDIPEVTQSGPLHVQNYATGIYRRMEMPDLPTTNREQYVDLAVKLGTDAEYRHEVSRRINRQKHLIFERDDDLPNWERFFEEAVENEKKNTERQGTMTSAVHFNPKEQSKEIVTINDLEINLVYGCNLKCEYCTHFCKYTQGIESLDNILSWYRTWNKKIMPKKMRLIGGEPFLHPNLKEVILETKRHWPKSKMQMTTNALLIHKVDEAVLGALTETDTHVFVSQHDNNPQFNEVFFRGVDCLTRFGIDYTIYTSYMDWRKTYHLDSQRRLLPYTSNPERAWQNCQTKNMCSTLFDNKIYKCQHITHCLRQRSSGLLGEEWNVVTTYQPLTQDATGQEILLHLNSDVVPACAVCPEYYEYVSLDAKNHGAKSDDRAVLK